MGLLNMPQFYQIYADRVKVLLVMRSNEPTDARSIRLSVDNYASNEEGTKSDDDDDCLKSFDTILPADQQHNTAEVTLSI